MSGEYSCRRLWRAIMRTPATTTTITPTATPTKLQKMTITGDDGCMSRCSRCCCSRFGVEATWFVLSRCAAPPKSHVAPEWRCACQNSLNAQSARSSSVRSLDSISEQSTWSPLHA